MTEDELQRHLAEESNSVDWKAGGDPEKIVKTLVAYANDFEEAGSGFVFCGVEEGADATGRPMAHVVGISGGEARRLRDRIFQLCRSVTSPPVEPRFEVVPLTEDREVLVVWVAASGEIHGFKGDVVIRIGDKVTNAVVTQIAALAQRKSHLDWLAQPCPGAKLDDIDLFALEDMARRFRAPGEPLSLLEPGFQIFGSALPLTSRIESPSGALTVPNRFAVLLLGKEPHRFLPGAFVALTRFRGLTRASEVFSSAELVGPIPWLLEKMMGALESEVAVITDKSQDFHSGAQNRNRYSVRALREVVVNALVHRDYRSSLSTKVFVFQDRIEIENPGGLEKGGSIDALKTGKTGWRNPSLARYMLALGLAQERGSGIPTAIEETVAMAGVEPIFEADYTAFKVTVPAYAPVAPDSGHTEIHPESVVLAISIGYGNIDNSLIRRSHEAFRDASADRILSYHYSKLVEAHEWPEMIRRVRNEVRDCLEDARFQEVHFFYRGPVAVGPLIGAITVGRKPMVVYYYDEEASLYRFAYRLDRRLLQEP